MTHTKQTANPKRNTKPIPYFQRTDLTDKEKSAISHYKDLRNEQYNWSLQIPTKDGLGIDCQIINGVLRDEYRYSDLTLRDKQRFTRTKNLINSAISKSPVHKKLVLFKGIKPFDGLNCYIKGATVPQPAFGSFTTSLDIARSYSHTNDDNEYVFFLMVLRRGDRALYVDSDEDEWIIETDTKYQVMGLKHGTVNGDRAIFYVLAITY